MQRERQGQLARLELLVWLVVQDLQEALDPQDQADPDATRTGRTEASAPPDLWDQQVQQAIPAVLALMETLERLGLLEYLEPRE